MMTVSSLNTKIKSLLEATFMHVVVEGEVSQATYHTSGHLYFTIKDDKSAVSCVMWRSSVAKLKFRLEKGMHIVIHGSVSVYTPRGAYQIQAVKIEPYGQGALALAFEQLKQKLQAKGYFDTSRKKPLPSIPRRIALVTAKESAALADMLRIIEVRWPLLEVIVVDTPVQGEEAKYAIVQALRYADGLGADIVVLARGGGSKEDLWAFNEEIVADAVFAMQTPVVTAIGHEIDTHIADMTADLRAPTPSAAMEMILPDRREVLMMLDERIERLQRYARRIVTLKTERWRHRREQLHHLSPFARLVRRQEEIDIQRERLHRQLVWLIERKEGQREQSQTFLRERIRALMYDLMRRRQQLEEQLLQTDPKRRVKKGWAQVVRSGKPIDIDALSVGDRFALHDAEYMLEAECLSKKKL